ncbi:MAG: sigma-70 family RNA polymerase sigma factor [Gemmatimonadota bacterium]|nr:MAG: sigma-70 family RNA polymerase sigma factor [Gemmatimonadota bacterium]
MRQLYEQHASRVYTVVRRLAGDEDLAADLAQDAWCNAFQKIRDFRGDAAFGTWVHRIAVNTALTRLRQRARRRDLERGYDGTSTLGNPDRWPASGVADRVTVQRALDMLPDGYRSVLWLHDVEGFTHEEIGVRLGIAVGTSKSQLSKARARLRALVTGSRTEVVDHGAS